MEILQTVPQSSDKDESHFSLFLEPELQSSQLKRLQQTLRSSASDNDGFRQALLEALASIDATLVDHSKQGEGDESQSLRQQVTTLTSNLENTEVRLFLNRFVHFSSMGRTCYVRLFFGRKSGGQRGQDLR